MGIDSVAAARSALEEQAGIAVLVVSPVRLHREGVALILVQEGITVVGTTSGGPKTVAAVAELAPDVVLLDPSAPDATETIRALASAETGVKVVVFSATDDESELIRFAEAGAAGYVGLESTRAELIAVIRSAARGELLCSPGVAGTLIRRVAALAPPPRADSAVRLTARERDVAQLLEAGLSNKQIARDLCIELATVKNHVHHILEKLEVERRGEAAARLRNGA